MQLLQNEPLGVYLGTRQGHAMTVGTLTTDRGCVPTQPVIRWSVLPGPNLVSYVGREICTTPTRACARGRRRTNGNPVARVDFPATPAMWAVLVVCGHGN